MPLAKAATLPSPGKRRTTRPRQRSGREPLGLREGDAAELGPSRRLCCSCAQRPEGFAPCPPVAQPRSAALSTRQENHGGPPRLSFPRTVTVAGDRVCLRRHRGRRGPTRTDLPVPERSRQCPGCRRSYSNGSARPRSCPLGTAGPGGVRLAGCGAHVGLQGARSAGHRDTRGSMGYCGTDAIAQEREARVLRGL